MSLVALHLHFLQCILSVTSVVIQCREVAEVESLAFTFTFLLDSADSVRLKYGICSVQFLRLGKI